MSWFYTQNVQFYTMHRMMHTWGTTSVPDVGKWLYENVHSLHHASKNPTAFSGISMHPGATAPLLPFVCAAPHAAAVEHMYYFSNAFIPALLLPVSPFVFLWLFVHLSFSPAAGHSGCVTPSLGFGLIGGPKSKIDNKSHLYC